MSSDGFIQSSLYLEEVKILPTLPSEVSGHTFNFLVMFILQFTQQSVLTTLSKYCWTLNSCPLRFPGIHPIILANNVYPSINLDNYRKLSLSLAKHMSNFALQGWLTTSGCNVMPEWYSILIRYLYQVHTYQVPYSILIRYLSGSYLSGTLLNI